MVEVLTREGLKDAILDATGPSHGVEEVCC
jgi:hypothetical protein